MLFIPYVFNITIRDGKIRLQRGNTAHFPHIPPTPTHPHLQYPAFFMCVLLCFPNFFCIPRNLAV